MPTDVLKGLSPFEKLFGRKPKYEQLKVFGCLCYAKVLPCMDKFASRSIPAIMMGYSLTRKGHQFVEFRNKNDVC